MPSTIVIVSVGMITISMIAGLIFYYFTAPFSKEIKKRYVEDITSLIINFVIYIWIGKILVNFTKFIQDPLAILAYPSNSTAFYVATILIIMNVIYRKQRHKQQVGPLVESFIPIFLSASFMYEFFQVIVEGNKTDWVYVTWLTLLLIAYLLTYERVNYKAVVCVMGFAWLFSQLLLSIFLHATIFGYRIEPVYFISLIIIIFVSIVFRNKRMV